MKRRGQRCKSQLPVELCEADCLDADLPPLHTKSLADRLIIVYSDIGTAARTRNPLEWMPSGG